MSKRRKRKPKCPNCKSTKVIPIVYGEPPPDIEEKSRQGKLIMGGCIIHESNPNWYCKSCGKAWKSDKTNPYGF